MPAAGLLVAAAVAATAAGVEAAVILGHALSSHAFHNVDHTSIITQSIR